MNVLISFLIKYSLVLNIVYVQGGQKCTNCRDFIFLALKLYGFFSNCTDFRPGNTLPPPPIYFYLISANLQKKILWKLGLCIPNNIRLVDCCFNSQLKFIHSFSSTLSFATGCPTKHDSWWIVLNVFFHILYYIH